MLSKATAVLAVLFMLGALALAIIGQRGPGSVISGSAPPPPVSAPARAGCAPAPATPTPGCAAPAAAAPTARASAGTGAVTPAGICNLKSEFQTHPSRKWRNWQTHQLEGLAIARSWGFESPLPHQNLESYQRCVRTPCESGGGTIPAGT